MAEVLCVARYASDGPVVSLVLVTALLISGMVFVLALAGKVITVRADSVVLVAALGAICTVVLVTALSVIGIVVLV
jgi:hypothetical protein